jgi:hypothetical protein
MTLGEEDLLVRAIEGLPIGHPTLQRPAHRIADSDTFRPPIPI